MVTIANPKVDCRRSRVKPGVMLARPSDGGRRMDDVLQIFNLYGRAAVVTGAGSGIGKSAAEVLGGAGASVVCGDLDEAAAEKTAATIVEAGGKAVAQGADVARKAEV